MTSKQKRSKTDANIAYQYVPHGSNERCDECAMFVPMAACTDVQGVISPSGWCKIFSPALRRGMQDPKR